MIGGRHFQKTEDLAQEITEGFIAAQPASDGVDVG